MLAKNNGARNWIELNRTQKLIFACCCCEQMLPNYQAFAHDTNNKNYHVLSSAMNRLWKAVEQEASSEELKKIKSVVSKLMPDDDRDLSIYTHLAQFTVMAVADTLSFCIHDDHDALNNVPSFALDSVDDFLQTINAPFEGGAPSEVIATDWITNTPIYVAELRAQNEDIAVLKSVSVVDSGLVAKLRLRSQGRGIQPIERGLVRT
jgi:uncharacterized protein YjaG (DUF416 family)